MKKEKCIGIATVGEKGQIVIPKNIREMFKINPGDSIVILCDKEKGITLIKGDILEKNLIDVLQSKVN